MSAQLPLLMRDQDRAVLAALRVRSACREVAEEIGIKVLGDEWGCGHAAVCNKLDENERRALKPEELLDLALRDRHGRIVAAICDATGFEAPERKRVLEPADKLAKLERAVNEMLGADLAEVLRKRAGL